ncbi:outer membrane assembly protein AsmA [Providencia rettgeri]|uniref:Outer membrane assembly protein AsmA n=2 Tax=Providencia rettgeri TaxID=587 RepID=A0AAP2NUF1_PRORE|nr:outer membrane assembly protein AsmA [Providencia rettgeri]MBX6953914.1 outer membrane assembly protein AsmA [Providencia rettgeri]MBX6959707.1 outer membrane assembly protein AsmA [Providencia rettgeri]MBX6972412.1 outer membrane assembly protein AsmA [Providencia rettgeri]MBX6979159.1 outer membrane assembly protein AsmA [Providencia rettgeri]MBX6986318.1 outer membrane assembly protein AsmA [Providencia rettgeri]
MKRFLTTLIILLVVIVAGLTTLVMLVNPNDFRHYIVEQVDKKSGYQLEFNGDMRWHVWPTLSIITGPISLTAPNATTPVLSAENMRLDVELWPLISHKLSVEQIVIDGAVIRKTPESEPKIHTNAPVAPGGTAPSSSPTEKTNWLLDIEKINISNSLVIWQTAKDEFNLRNINLSLKKSDKKQIAAKFSGNLNKNQQELIFDTRADIDLSNINQKISGKLTQFDYKLSGVDLPENGIEGQITSDFLYSKGKIENASLSNLLIKANESSLTGNISIQLTDIPKVAIELVSDKLDLDNLLGTAAADSNSTAETNNNRIGVKPVISGSNTQQYDLSGLQSFTADINLAINHLVYRGMTVTDVVFEAQNQAPRFSVAKLQGKAFGGDFSLPVTLNYRSTPAYVSAKPKFNHIDLTPLLKAFNMPQKISGIISLNATLSGIGYDDYAVKNQWQGPVSFELRNAKLQGLNIPQLIQQSVSRVTNKINAPVNTGNYTEVDLFKVAGILNKGNLNISSMQATSALVNINGQGNMNIPNETIDVNLGVNIANGWGGDSRLVKQLQEMTIPLRIYGSWYSLQYQLDVEKLLRNELRTQAKEAIGNFLKKEENKGLNDLLNAL